MEKLNQIRSVLQGNSGPQTSLVLPNPIDATGIRSVQALDPQVSSAAANFTLPFLSTANKLENGFLKIRQHEITDATSLLAAPTSAGDFRFPITDPHYQEVMAYHSISQLQQYAEAMGFSLIKDRPLYVMVRAFENGKMTQDVNAFYSHNTFSPSQPRTIKLFGDTSFAPGIDRDIFWHEFGHYLNESLSANSGIDLAGESGAIFTEGAALHECLADYWAESVGNRPYIGKWVARNFPEIAEGEPLRSAVDGKSALNFATILAAKSDGTVPEKYTVAEWCSRALWEFREQLVREDPQAGAVLADRLILGAVTQLGRDSSLSDFRKALQTSDETLHCGLHQKSLRQAFEGRGFVSEPEQLDVGLKLSARPLSLSVDNSGNWQAGQAKAGKTIGFELRVNNPSALTARNVRVRLESKSSAFTVTTYLQAFGNLLPGQSIVVSAQGPLSFDYSVSGEWGAGGSGSVPYRVRVLVENGPETVWEGDLLK